MPIFREPLSHEEKKALVVTGATVIGSICLIVLVAVGVSGCSRITEGVQLDEECELMCKDCGFVSMRCNNEKGRETDSEAEGTISGPSTN